MSERRWIKKYPNRRLYDTAECRYITLADIRRLIVENIDFVVTVKRTREDITRSIVMQVLADQELGREPLMSEDFLLLVIQSHGGAIQGEVSTHLERSLKLFLARRQFFGGGPLLRDPKPAEAAGAGSCTVGNEAA
jgi:polyhydroxyalkanoate synthesis repressor PhaR